MVSIKTVAEMWIDWNNTQPIGGANSGTRDAFYAGIEAMLGVVNEREYMLREDYEDGVQRIRDEIAMRNSAAGRA